MIPFNSHLLLIRWGCRLPSTLLSSKLPTWTPARRLTHNRPASTILKTFHTSRRRHKIDESPAASEATPEYEYIEDCERLERYSPGGFYPIKLVWLASDQKQQELVAIKVKTADSASNSHEVEIQKQLHGHPLIRKLLGSFIENSPNGAHNCLVIEAASCSLTQAKFRASHGLLDLPIARAIVADLILAVQFLHGQGIVHGDLHCGNIFLRLPTDVRRMTDPSQLYQKFGDPIFEPIVRVDRKPLPAGVPTHIVWPASLGIRSDQITSTYLPIMLSDFGSSYYPSKQYELAHIRSLTLSHRKFSSLTSKMMKTPFRSPVEASSRTKSMFWEGFLTHGGNNGSPGLSFFNEDATIDSTTGAPVRDSLKERYDWFVNAARRRYDMEEQGEDEKKAFLHMIGMMLRYLPGDRATIQDIIESEWIQKWGLPAKAGIK